MSLGSSGPRITDLSSIAPENFKFRNTAFLNSDQEYEQTGLETYQDLRHQIWVTRNGDIEKVLDRFPLNDCVYNQCAGWMHAVAGKHFFPDANHRTAIAILRELLRDNGIPPGRWPLDISTKTVIRSHNVRRNTEPVELDTLYRRDKLFLVWVLYFKMVLKVPEN